MNPGVGLLLVILTAAEAKDPLGDLQRFPPHSHATLQYLIVRQRREAFKREWCIGDPNESAYLCYTLSTARPWVKDEAVTHYQRLLWESGCWFQLMYATSDRAPECRIAAMKQLRELLGEDNWAAGQMPNGW